MLTDAKFLMVLRDVLIFLPIFLTYLAFALSLLIEFFGNLLEYLADFWFEVFPDQLRDILCFG